MTDIELDARVTVLEKNTGGGDQNGTGLSAILENSHHFVKVNNAEIGRTNYMNK